jgi:PAS domain S-box-containing protein
MTPARPKRKKTGLAFTNIAIQPGDIVVMLDQNGRVVQWNEEAERVLGFSAEEVVGQPWAVVFPNSGLDIKAVLAGKEFANGFEARRKDSARVGLYFYATAVRNDQGMIAGVVCVGRDVTHFWHPNEQVEEVEKRFATLSELTTDGVLILTSRGRIVKANDAAAELLAVPNPEFLVGRNIGDFVEPAKKTELTSFRNILFRQGRHNALISVKTFSGEVRQVAVRAAVVEGAREWHIVVAGRDITKEVAARATEILAEEKFRRVFEASPTALFLETVDGTIVDVNVKGVEMFQTTREAMIGKKLRDLVPDDVKPLFPEIRAVLFDRGEVNINVVSTLPDGRRVWAEVAATFIEVGGKGFILVNIRDITREKQLLEKIKEDEARLELLFRSIPAFVWTTDIERRITSVMGSALSKLGLTPEELIGKKCEEFFKEPIVNEAHLQALKGEAVHINFSYQGRSYQGQVEPFRSDEGTLVGVVGVAQDVTEIRLVEAEAQERMVAYQTLMNTAPVGIGVHQDGKIVMVNPAGARLLGYDDPQEVVGLNVLDIVHPEDRPLAIKRIRDVIEQQKHGAPVEERFRRRDGSYVPIEVVNAPFLWKGRPAVLVVVRDLSGEKQLTQRAEEAWLHAKAILETSPHGIAAQTDGRIVFANPAFARMFGYSLEELIGMPVKELIPEYEEKRIAEYAAARLKGEPAPVRYQVDGRRKDGTVFRLKAEVTTYEIGGKRYALGFVTTGSSD